MSKSILEGLCLRVMTAGDLLARENRLLQCRDRQVRKKFGLEKKAYFRFLGRFLNENSGVW